MLRRGLTLFTVRRAHIELYGNRQPEAGPETAFLGAEQLAWLKRELATSQATWKAIAADMPIGLVVPDQHPGEALRYEAIANDEPGPPLGRELQIAERLRYVQRAGIRNLVWFTADVHYAAGHHYDPERAQIGDFDPFWEFVAGPINAGTFGPNTLDPTFGPELVFQEVAEVANQSPLDERQYFGLARIDAASQVMTVQLLNIAGAVLFEVDLEPRRD